MEEIDVGEAQPRTVVSGLVKYIPLEEMQVCVHSFSVLECAICMQTLNLVRFGIMKYFILVFLAESEGLCSLQSKACSHEGYKIPCNGSLCF